MKQPFSILKKNKINTADDILDWKTAMSQSQENIF